jgi:hypothetical protein
MQDESRHVAFGVISVANFYKELSESERREREEFAYEACLLMSERLNGREVWEKLGLPLAECLDYAHNSPLMLNFRQNLFARVIPNLKRLGLLSDHIRPRYQALGVLRYENEPSADQEFMFAEKPCANDSTNENANAHAND